MLHPEYTKSCLPKQESLWTPGYYSKTPVGKQKIYLSERNTVIPGDKSNKQRVGTLAMRMKGVTTFCKDIKRQPVISKYDPNDPGLDLCRKMPVVACSGVYETVRQREQKYMNEQKKLEIGPHSIRLGKSDWREIQNYVVKDYSEPTGNYQFRNEVPSKWIGKPFKCV